MEGRLLEKKKVVGGEGRKEGERTMRNNNPSMLYVYTNMSKLLVHITDLKNKTNKNNMEQTKKSKTRREK